MGLKKLKTDAKGVIKMIINGTATAMSYPKRSMYDSMAEVDNAYADAMLKAKKIKKGKIKSNSY